MAPHKPSLSLVDLEVRSRNLLTCAHLKVKGFPLLTELFLPAGALASASLSYLSSALPFPTS